MELWLELLFGNPIGLMSMIVIFVTIGICTYFAYFIISKSKGEANKSELDGNQHSHGT